MGLGRNGGGEDFSAGIHGHGQGNPVLLESGIGSQRGFGIGTEHRTGKREKGGYEGTRSIGLIMQGEGFNAIGVGGFDAHRDGVGRLWGLRSVGDLPHLRRSVVGEGLVLESGRREGGPPTGPKIVVEGGIGQLHGSAAIDDGPGEAGGIVNTIDDGSGGISQSDLLAISRERAGELEIVIWAFADDEIFRDVQSGPGREDEIDALEVGAA